MSDSRVGAGGRQAGRDRLRTKFTKPARAVDYSRESRTSQPELPVAARSVSLSLADVLRSTHYADDSTGCPSGVLNAVHFYFSTGR